MEKPFALFLGFQKLFWSILCQNLNAFFKKFDKLQKSREINQIKNIYKSMSITQ